jgi:hypothetical protein
LDYFALWLLETIVSSRKMCELALVFCRYGPV